MPKLTAEKKDKLARKRREFASRLAALMEERGLSQAQLAKDAKIHESTLSFILNGRRGASEDVRERLAAVLGVEVRELLGQPPAAAARAGAPRPTGMSDPAARLTLDMFREAARGNLENRLQQLQRVRTYVDPKGLTWDGWWDLLGVIEAESTHPGRGGVGGAHGQPDPLPKPAPK